MAITYHGRAKLLKPEERTPKEDAPVVKPDKPVDDRPRFKNGKLKKAGRTPGTKGAPLKRPPPPPRKGSITRREKTVLARLMKIKNIGELPHELLLRVSQGNQIKHGRLYINPSWEDRIDAAKAAAPYFAPKMSTVEVIKNLDDDDLDRIITGLAAEAGVSVSVSGTGEEAKVEVRAGIRVGAADPSVRELHIAGGSGGASLPRLAPTRPV